MENLLLYFRQPHSELPIIISIPGRKEVQVSRSKEKETPMMLKVLKNQCSSEIIAGEGGGCGGKGPPHGEGGGRG